MGNSGVLNTIKKMFGLETPSRNTVKPNWPIHSQPVAQKPAEQSYIVGSFHNNNISYDVTPGLIMCTCPDWQKNRSFFSDDDPRRLCKHIISFLHENPRHHHGFGLFKEKLDWCYEKQKGFPLFGEQFKSGDDEFEIIGFMPRVEQWNFEDEGFWIELYYKNIRFAYNPVHQVWTRNHKILTDDVNMEKAILYQILPNYPRWIQYQNSLSKAKPTSKIKSIFDPERRALLQGLDDFERWVAVLKEDLPNIHKFDLFETRAALLWKENSNEVDVVCLNRFTRGVPDEGSKYDYFCFNIQQWYWSGLQPKGCANKIKNKLTELFKG